MMKRSALRRMRFDDVKGPAIRFRDVPASMRPVPLSADYTPYPLPRRDETFEFGPTRIRNIPDVQAARRAMVDTMTEDVAPEDDVAARLGLEEDIPSAAPEVAAVLSPEEAEAAEELEGVERLKQFQEVIRKAVEARAAQRRLDVATAQASSLPVQYAPMDLGDDGRLIDLLECRKPVAEIIALYTKGTTSKRRDMQHVLSLLDLASTTGRQTRDELVQVLGAIGSKFTTEEAIGSNFQRSNMRNVKGSPRTGVQYASPLLLNAYFSYIQQLEAELAIDAPWRLQDAGVLAAVLTFASQMQLRNYRSWFQVNDIHTSFRFMMSGRGLRKRETDAFTVCDSLFEAIGTTISTNAGDWMAAASVAELIDVFCALAAFTVPGQSTDASAASRLVEAIAARAAEVSPSQRFALWFACRAASITSPTVMVLVADAIRAGSVLDYEGLQALAREKNDATLRSIAAATDPLLQDGTATAAQLRSATLAEHMRRSLRKARAEVDAAPADDPTALAAATGRLHDVAVAVYEGLGVLPAAEALPLCEALDIDCAALDAVRHFSRRPPSRTTEGESGDVAALPVPRLPHQPSSSTSSVSPVSSEAFRARFRSPMTDTEAVRSTARCLVLHTSYCTGHRNVLVSVLRSAFQDARSAIVVPTAVLLSLQRLSRSHPRHTTRAAAGKSLKLLALAAHRRNSPVFVVPASEELAMRGCNAGVLSDDNAVWLCQAWITRHCPAVIASVGCANGSAVGDPERVVHDSPGGDARSRDRHMRILSNALSHWRLDDGQRRSHGRLAENIASSRSLGALVQRPRPSIKDSRQTMATYSLSRGRRWGAKDGGIRDKVQLGHSRIGYGLLMGARDADVANLGLYTPDYPSVDRRLRPTAADV